MGSKCRDVSCVRGGCRLRGRQAALPLLTGMRIHQPNQTVSFKVLRIQKGGKLGPPSRGSKHGLGTPLRHGVSQGCGTARQLSISFTFLFDNYPKKGTFLTCGAKECVLQIKAYNKLIDWNVSQEAASMTGWSDAGSLPPWTSSQREKSSWDFWLWLSGQAPTPGCRNSCTLTDHYSMLVCFPRGSWALISYCW